MVLLVTLAVLVLKGVLPVGIGSLALSVTGTIRNTVPITGRREMAVALVVLVSVAIIVAGTIALVLIVVEHVGKSVVISRIWY